MSVLSNSNAIPSGGAGYTMADSLRLRQSASASFSRTPSSAGNRRTWTWSAWIKRGELTTPYATLFDATGSGNIYHFFRFDNVKLNIVMDNTYSLATDAVLRDPSAWYHIVVANDTTQGTSTNRIKVWINGVQQSMSGSYPSQNFEGNINGGFQHSFGKLIYANAYHWDGYVADAYLIDGQALTASDFGEYGEETGAWQAKAYTGTYGSNGYYLDMSTSGSTITDQSGNSNNWTASNMNLTTSSATTYDIMSDVPTLTDEDTGNFCTLNPILPNPNSGTMSEANLAWAGASHSGTRGTFGMTSGKWYWEVTNTSGSDNGVGISQDQEALGFLGNAYGWSYYGNGLKYTSGSGSSYGASYTTNDVIGVAFDADAGNLVFYKNGVSQGTAYTGLTSSPYYPAISSYYGTLKVNFGQRPFAHTPPTGYKKLNTYNLPDSAVPDGSQYFDTVLWTGNGVNPRNITGLNFKPDFVWLKSRSQAFDHQVYDSNRGVTKALYTSGTYAEVTNQSTGTLQSFNSDGFTLGGTSNNNDVNGSGYTFASWNWRGSDSSAVSNTDGTITSTVSANTTAGCSIVTYTGNSTAGATVGHGLGVAPKMVIVKQRNSGGTSWTVWHSSVASTYGASYTVFLESTSAALSIPSAFNSTAPSSTVFTLGTGGGSTATNISGNTYVAYCFADVEGFSKFGSYTGNGSTDGPFIYTGFRPAFIMTKCISSGGEWEMYDTSRGSYNAVTSTLEAQSSTSELNYYTIDILSNGFKQRNYYNTQNQSGATFIYMAFAENPYKHSLAR